MAPFAFDECMRSYQREAVLVIADGLHCHIPSLDRMTTLAVGAHLAAMDIRMAIGTMLANIFKDEAGVALCTRNLLVHAAERVSRHVVIELGYSPYGIPTCVGMAILAWHCNGAMRVCDRRMRGGCL